MHAGATSDSTDLKCFLYLGACLASATHPTIYVGKIMHKMDKVCKL